MRKLFVKNIQSWSVAKLAIVTVNVVLLMLSLMGLAYDVRANREKKDQLARNISDSTIPRAMPTEDADVLTAALSKSLQASILAPQGALVTLRPQGFQPTVITRSGRFFLVINNQTSLNEITLNIDRENGGRLRSAPMTRGRPFSAHDLDLTPGRYVLSEANHPNWVCKLTVTPN